MADDAADIPDAEPVSSWFQERAKLQGHTQWITSLQVTSDHQNLVSASRDKTALVWQLPRKQEAWAVEETRLIGHNHFVSDASFSSDATHLLTSSWDKTVRLWDLTTRSTKKLFLDHKKDVLAVTFSPCNRRIITCARDKTVKLWNILGECKVTLTCDSWPTSVACAPMADPSSPVVIAVGHWDGSVKVWQISDTVTDLFTLQAHNGRCLAVAFTPNGEFIITGGSDRKLLMWNMQNGSKWTSLSAPDVINAIAPSPTKTWLCAATYEGIAVWDVEKKAQIDLVQPNYPQTKNQKGRTPDCTALAWSEDGSALYAGYSNGDIRVWEPRSE
jgi:guanine nucleotide-binding protein subunit beta-2-like 1 protein